MADKKDTILVRVAYYDGSDPDDDGQPYYVAECDDLHFVTNGKTFEALLAAIRECLELTLHDVNSTEIYGIATDAKVIIQMEMSEYA